MRTSEEIVEYIQLTSKDDFLGFTRQLLCSYLPWAHMTPFLKEGADPIGEGGVHWDESIREPTRESVLEDMRDYMSFAWGKVEDHRGISAQRSVDKMTAWAWLLEDEALIEKIKQAPYPMYGAPVLKVICEHLELPIPESADVVRMSNGEPCSPGCSGCN